MTHRADIILYNAKILTLDPLYPRASTMVISGETILAIGDKSLRADYRTHLIKEIDCQEKTIIPGFHDAHCHIVSLANSLMNVDCSPSQVHSVKEISDLIAKQASLTPAGQWIIGEQYDEFYLEEKRHLNRYDLDRSSQEHPVRLNHRSRHACVLNSAGLTLASITTETPDPPGGLIDREPQSGEPTGLLFEMEDYLKSVIPHNKEGLLSGIKLANDMFLSSGITSLQDASVNNDFSQWQLFQEIKNKNCLQSRISLMPGNKSLAEFINRGMSFRYGDNHLRLGAVKVILDRTTGKLYPSPKEFEEIVFSAHKAGFQVAVHAVEKEELEVAVAALEKTLQKYPENNRRHRLEHCSLCTDALIKRLANLGVVVVTHPAFIFYNGDRYLDQVPEEDIPHLYRMNSLIKSGLITAAGSDAPVVPVNPLVGIYGAVTRCTRGGKFVLSQEGLSFLDALKMFTEHAAYSNFEESYKGTLSPGKLADIAVLSQDPTKVDVEELKEIKVEMTIIGGKVVWEV